MATAEKHAPIVFVTEGGPHVWAIVNAVADRFGPVTVILESPESKRRLLRRRARRQGWIATAGQLATMVLIRLAKRFNASHAAGIAVQHGLVTEPGPDQAIVAVPSANAPECLDAIAALKPGVVFLAGCRMLTRETLTKMPCPVINYHAGISPKYRGMNGGYWALATGDADNFGTTVHFVDAGVDTGGVLKQMYGKPEKGDTIASYPLRQAAFSRGICVEAVEELLAGTAKTFEPALPSKQWYHPTIWFYLWTGLARGVW